VHAVIVRRAPRRESRRSLILAYAGRDSVSPLIDAWYKPRMRRTRTRMAAWASLLAMALHAAAPLAAPAPRAGGQYLHDVCSSAPTAPQPAGDPSSSHCALCVAPAALASTARALGVLSVRPHIQPVAAHTAHAPRPPHPSASPRAPPASA
jgi:hypothetical protein